MTPPPETNASLDPRALIAELAKLAARQLVGSRFPEGWTHISFPKHWDGTSEERASVWLFD